MLDEAIEYLKMLQLQLQVFALLNPIPTNRLSYHIYCQHPMFGSASLVYQVLMLSRRTNLTILFEQMMSIRTGMTLPPMVVPPGLQQHMQMPQMAAMPSMGMGMGMVQMGLGMGMMDMGVPAQGRAVMPMPTHAGPSLGGNMASPSSLTDMHDLRYQTSGGVPMDSYNAYLARQHQPMQMNQVDLKPMLQCNLRTGS